MNNSVLLNAMDIAKKHERDQLYVFLHEMPKNIDGNMLTIKTQLNYKY